MLEVGDRATVCSSCAVRTSAMSQWDRLKRGIELESSRNPPLDANLPPTHPQIMCIQMFLKFQYVAFVSVPDYIFYLNSWLRKHLKAFNSDGNVCFLLLGKSLGVEFTLLPPGDSMLCSSSLNCVGYLLNDYLILLKVWLWKYYGHNCKILGETNCPSILLYVMAQWDTCYCQWQSMMVTIRMIKIFVYFVLVLESQLPTLTFSHCGHSLTGGGGGRAWNFQVFFNLYRTNVQMGFDHWVANFLCQHVFNVVNSY